MTRLAQSNIFNVPAEEIRDLFADYLDGSDACAALAVSQAPLGADARDALEKSLSSFGYGPRALTYATLLPGDASVEGGDVPLDPQALFLLVEGLDPTCVICADAAAAECIGRAYRIALDLDAPARIMGRPAVVMGDLQALLTSERGKQQAWRLLKSLPKR